MGAAPVFVFELEKEMVSPEQIVKSVALISAVGVSVWVTVTVFSTAVEHINASVAVTV